MKSITSYFSGLASRLGQAFEESSRLQNETAATLWESAEKTRAEFLEKASDPKRSLVSRIGYKIGAALSYAGASYYPMGPMM